MKPMSEVESALLQEVFSIPKDHLFYDPEYVSAHPEEVEKWRAVLQEYIQDRKEKCPRLWQLLDTDEIIDAISLPCTFDHWTLSSEERELTQCDVRKTIPAGLKTISEIIGENTRWRVENDSIVFPMYHGKIPSREAFLLTCFDEMSYKLEADIAIMQEKIANSEKIAHQLLHPDFYPRPLTPFERDVFTKKALLVSLLNIDEDGYYNREETANREGFPFFKKQFDALDNPTEEQISIFFQSFIGYLRTLAPFLCQGMEKGIFPTIPCPLKTEELMAQYGTNVYEGIMKTWMDLPLQEQWEITLPSQNLDFYPFTKRPIWLEKFKMTENDDDRLLCCAISRALFPLENDFALFFNRQEEIVKKMLTNIKTERPDINAAELNDFIRQESLPNDEDNAPSL